ncbi:hypothetical protein FPV67DRAFT_1670508 [Lyophyllum atratum]|nr:hypothetical protein FPV67DRAFT_1682618 [Lyophyllum atratum]KAF8067050.1 hypothetical protein FPV67DRAFT_1670508 [Lyophyllum atratum]
MKFNLIALAALIGQIALIAPTLGAPVDDGIDALLLARAELQGPGGGRNRCQPWEWWCRQRPQRCRPWEWWCHRQQNCRPWEWWCHGGRMNVAEVGNTQAKAGVAAKAANAAKAGTAAEQLHNREIEEEFEEFD